MGYIAVSGGMDPFHVGHLYYLLEASRFGPVLIFLNSDEWLMRKKGYVFMPFLERKIVLSSISCLTRVEKALDDDGTVCESIRKHRHEIRAFAKGGDRGFENTPEIDLCSELEIPVIFGLGKKIQSSSDLVKRALESVQKSQS